MDFSVAQTQPAEIRVVLAAAGILSLRMLGLFMVLPVFVLFATAEQSGSNSLLLGLALGGYGLTQALLQVPLGRLSDAWGRRRVIAGGLLVFMLGSVIAAGADSILQLVIGRLLQGAGAISSAVLALVGDVTSPRRRSLSMALVGMAMGGAFLLALVIGPALGSAGLSLSGFFWLAAGFGLLSLLLVTVLPEPAVRTRSVAPLRGALLAELILAARWRRWNLSIFVIHLLMSGCFIAMPLLLVREIGLPVAEHGWLYLTTLVASCVLAMPLLVFCEKRWSDTATWPVAALFFLAGLGLLVTMEITRLTAWLGLMLFFAGFNLMEAGLPAGVSRRTQSANRGLVMGVFASHQFLGAFAGGVMGGGLLQLGGPELVLQGMLVVAGLWSVSALSGAGATMPDEYVFEPAERMRFRLADRKEEFLRLPGVRAVRADQDSGAIIVQFERGSFRAGPVWDLLDQICKPSEPLSGCRK